MSNNLTKTEETCQYCEYSVNGRDIDERACFNISGIRLAILGPLYVNRNHSCAKFCLAKKHGDHIR